MKKLLLLPIFIFFANNILLSQDRSLFLKDLNIKQIGENQINVSLKVFSPDLATYNTFSVENNNTTTILKVCYNTFFVPSISNLENDFQINLPLPVSQYTLKVQVYESGSGGCTYQTSNMQDSATLDFTMPFAGTISLDNDDITNYNNNLKLYPNPTNDIVKFSEEISDLKILDLSGKLIKQSSAATKSFDVSKLSKGKYLILITTKDGQSVRKQFIKE